MKLSRGARWTLAGAVVLLVAALAAPFLVPVERFIPEIERIAAEKLGQPVKIGGLSMHLLPTPRVVARSIEAGRRKEAAVAELAIVPDVLSLLAGAPSIRLVRAEGVDLKEAALGLAGALPKSEGSGGQAVRIGRVQLHRVRLQHSTLKVPELDLDVSFDDAMQPRDIVLESRDTKLRVAFKAAGKDAADVAIDGRLFGGATKGEARVAWGRQVQLAGKATLEGVDLVPVQVLLGKPAQFSGRLKAEPAFSAKARSADQLAAALVLDSPVRIVDGVYQGYDLSKVGGLSTKLEAGGSTRFDELKGNVEVRGRQVRVTELCARSPSVIASGTVEISPEQQLSGKLDVSLAKAGGFVGVPISLKGTTSDPWFTPTKGYLIGAAVGTVLLPGIGTSIGSSLGSRIEGKAEGCS